MPTHSIDFIVNKNDFSDVQYVETELVGSDGLAPGEALLKVDEFAFTANNVTYAVAGDSFSYWDFFPAQQGWGRIPVWGFADIIESASDELAVGERVYGYLPMSTYLKIQPGKMTTHSFMDVVAHRAPRSPIYNQYTFTRMDPTYSKEGEALISLFRPLFSTSFLLADYQMSNDFFGAKSVILSSASSKTAIGLAYLLSKQEGISVMGLTSRSNMQFVESLGYYDQVIAYDDLESLTVQASTFVDMAGNGSVLARVHKHFGDELKDSCLVGATHWDTSGLRGEELPGAKPEIFFAPGYAQTRLKEWGPDGFQKRLGAGWSGFIPDAQNWMSVTRSHGTDAVSKVYQDTLANRVNPSEGHILSLWD